MQIVTHPSITEISYSTIHSSWGDLLVGSTDQGICFVGFVGGERDAYADLQHRFAQATLKAAVTPQHTALYHHLQGRAADEIVLHLNGTPFQLLVWEALLQLREAQVSYLTIATGIGRPRAVRAVASAIGDNPIALLIPCHQVLRSDGGLGGYHWGIAAKQRLLATPPPALR